MSNIHSQRGMGMPLTIVIGTLALVIAGVAYYAIQQQARRAKNTQEEAVMKNEE